MIGLLYFERSQGRYLFVTHVIDIKKKKQQQQQAQNRGIPDGIFNVLTYVLTIPFVQVRIRSLSLAFRFPFSSFRRGSTSDVQKYHQVRILSCLRVE